MANPRFAWGIDVGNRALKAIKLVRDGSGLRVDDVDIIEHEHILSDAGDNKESLVAQSLATFAQKHPERGGAVAIGASGQSSFARFIKLPPVEDKKIPEIVKFEAIQQIPFPLDDVEWAYQLFQDEASPEKEVGIFAMRKELVNAHIKQFTDAGLNVQVVQMNPLAVYNAMYYDQRIKGTTMIVDVGAENTDLIIAEGEQIWLRSIPVGGNNFTESLTKQFKVKFPKAEDLKRNAATNKYTRQILQAMRPVFDSLVAEIQRSIGFYASVHRDSRISRVIALGGTFRLPGLMKFLQMQLQLDVQRFDALGASPPADARVATLLNDNILSTVSSYGLALQAMGEGKINSSLLPLTIRRERMWRDKTKWFAAAAALCVLGLGVQVGRVFFEQRQFASTEPERTTITRDYGDAKRLSDAWQQVEESGKPERTQIATLQSLTKQRELWEKIVTTVDTVLPEPTPKPKSAGDRASRAVVLLDDMTTQYYEDLAPALAKNDKGKFTMSPNEFSANATKPGTMSNTTLRTMSRQLGASGFRSAAAPVEGAPPANKQRGYLITLTCVTPMKRSSAVADQVRLALLQATAQEPGATERKDFRIERVEIVEQKDLKTAYPNGRKPVRQFTAAQGRGGRTTPTAVRGGRTYSPFGAVSDDMEGFVGGGTGYRNRSGVGIGGQPPRGPTRFNPKRPNGTAAPAPGANGVRNPATPGNDPAATAGTDDTLTHARPPLLVDQPINTDPNAPVQILDPVTGEDASNDKLLTFLVAVLIDPPPPPPKPAAPEGAAAPAQTASSPSNGATHQNVIAAGNVR